VKRARLAADDAVRWADLLPAHPVGEFVVVDGARTFVRHTPGRRAGLPPALYVHGLGGSSANWTDLADLLADRLDGQAIDLPGFGRSDIARRYTVAAMGQRVIRWIEAAGRGPVHLFGNSMGGAVVVHVAAVRPDLVRTLTLISPALPFLDPRRSAQGALVPLVFLPLARVVAARRIALMDPEELTRLAIETCYADPSCVPPQRLAEAIEEARRRNADPQDYTDAYIRSLRGLVGSFLRAYLPGAGSLWRIASRIAAPTLVIGGRQDKLVDIRVAPQTARAIPDSRLLILDGVGHVAQMEVPRLVARAVIAMLDEVGPEIEPGGPVVADLTSGSGPGPDDQPAVAAEW